MVIELVVKVFGIEWFVIGVCIKSLLGIDIDLFVDWVDWVIDVNDVDSVWVIVWCGVDVVFLLVIIVVEVMVVRFIWIYCLSEGKIGIGEGLGKWSIMVILVVIID